MLCLLPLPPGLFSFSFLLKEKKKLVNASTHHTYICMCALPMYKWLYQEPPFAGLTFTQWVYELWLFLDHYSVSMHVHCGFSKT